jgi:hypothetical protein
MQLYSQRRVGLELLKPAGYFFWAQLIDPQNSSAHSNLHASHPPPCARSPSKQLSDLVVEAEIGAG